MSKPLSILAASISVLTPAAIYAQSSSAAEIAELRRELQSLRSTVQELKQQVNQARLAPVFHENPPSLQRADIPPKPEAHDHKTVQEPAASLFNPEMTVALDTVGSYSRQADNINFIARDVQVALAADIDDFARAYVVLNAATELEPLEKTDPFEEINMGLEEAAIETRSLPWGWKIRAGQFFADFTRLGKVHAHDLPFTDRPRSVEQLIGGESKARGVEVTWLPPILPSTRFTAGIVDNVGAEPYVLSRFTNLDGEQEDNGLFADRRGGRGFGNLTYYGRVASTFQLGSNVTLDVGADYLRGRDSGTKQLASGDAVLRWAPRPGRSDLFELGGEFLWGRQSGRFTDDFTLPDGSAGSGSARGRGGYVYAQYRFGQFFEPGVRFDYLKADEFAESDVDRDGGRDTITRRSGSVATYTAYANFHLGASNRVRLQLNYLRGERGVFAGADDDLQAFIQWTVLMGEARAEEHTHQDHAH